MQALRRMLCGRSLGIGTMLGNNGSGWGEVTLKPLKEYKKRKKIIGFSISISISISILKIQFRRFLVFFAFFSLNPPAHHGEAP
jgi:hypothetical protein